MGVIKDAITVLQWVKNMTSSKIFIWGHSLGTGISTHALHILGLENIHVDGLILESPFNNIRCEVGEHPSTLVLYNNSFSCIHTANFKFISFLQFRILILYMFTN